MGYMQAIQPLKIEVKFDLRDDGGLRAWCDAVPGFVLSHSDPELVIADVPEVLGTILSAMMGRPILVTPMIDVAEALGVSEPSLPAYAMDRAYVGQYAEAC